MFRWGILSTAKIAREHVIPAIQQSRNGIVAAIASRDQAKADATAQLLQIPKAYGSYEAMLQAPDIDGVYIGVTTAQHVEWALAAIAAGKPVLCEKPMGLSADDVRRVMDAASSASVLVSEAFMVHHHPQWQRVRQWISEGQIGELAQVQGAFSYYNRDPGNMRNQVSLGGGAVPDIGVYPLVTTRMATGEEPLSVMAAVERDPDFVTDRFASVQMAFPSFQLGFYVSSQMHMCQSMHFAGTKGWISLDTPFNTSVYGHAAVRLHTERGEVVERFSDNQYKLQVEAFVDCATGQGGDCFTLESSWHNQRAIDAIYEAAESGERCHISQGDSGRN